MTAITNVYPKVRIEAPGAPDPLIKDVVGDAMRDFFRESEVWRYTCPSLLDWTTAAVFPTLSAGTEIPADTRVIRVDRVKYASDGTNLKTVPFSTRQQLDDEYPDWEVRTGSSPQRWTNDGIGADPRLIPIATANVLGSLQVRVIIAPTSAMTDIPAYWYDEYHDLWRFGALGRLLKMPGRDWTNPEMAAYYFKLYNEGIALAKSRVQAEFGMPDRTMAYGGI